MTLFFDIALFAAALAVALGTIMVTLRAQLARLIEVLAGEADAMPLPQARVVRLVAAPVPAMLPRRAAA